MSSLQCSEQGTWAWTEKGFPAPRPQASLRASSTAPLLSFPCSVFISDPHHLRLESAPLIHPLIFGNSPFKLSLSLLSAQPTPRLRGQGEIPPHSRRCLRTLLWEELPLATYSTITMQLCAFPPLQSELHPPSSYVEVPTPSTSEFNSI